MNGRANTRDLPSVGVPPGLAAGLLALLLLGLIAAGIILSLFDPARHAFYPACLFHRTTGWLCPGCGSLRAFHHLLNAELLQALRHNVLVVLSLPLFAWLAGRLALAALGRPTRSFVINNRWIWIGLTILLGFGLLRNLPFAQQFWLAP